MRSVIILSWYLVSIAANAQQAWTQRADIGYHQPNGPESQWYGAAFSIGQYAYVTCGELQNFQHTNSTWRYHPGNGDWDPRAPFPGTARIHSTASTINGKGYVFGGYPGTGNELWEYDPNTDSWSQRSSLPGEGRSNAVAFVLNDKLHICTGTNIATYALFQDHWAYDPAIDQWTQLAALPGPARKGAVAFVLEGKGYVGTGSTGGITQVNDLWEYDPALNNWAVRTGPGTTPRSHAFAFVVNDIPYIGSGSTDTTLWQYDQMNDSWMAFPMMHDQNISARTCFVIESNAYVMLGGWGEFKKTSSWHFNGIQQSWSKINGMGGIIRRGSVTFSNDSSGFVCSGNVSDAFNLLLDHWRYDPLEDRWQPLQYHPGLGRLSAASFAGNGNGYVLTGYTWGIEQAEHVPGMLEYDIAADNWQVLPFPSSLHRFHGVAFWANDKGYVGLGDYSNDLWEYDPVTATWTEKTSLPVTGRSGSRAVVLNNKAYIIGGDTTSNNSNGIVNEVWEYDPIFDDWQQRTSYPGAPGFTAVVVNGKAYLSSNDEMWEYDPILDIWLPKTPSPIDLNGSSFAFSIGDKGYFGGGVDASNGPARKIFYEYSPADDDFTIGIPEASNIDLKVWPNPASNGEFTMHFNGNSAEKASVEIYDIAGRTVVSQVIELTTDRIKVKMNTAMPGAYSVVLHDGQRSLHTKLIVQ